MGHTYKSHTIVITCWAVLEHPSGFTPQVRITISNKSPIVTKTFQFTDRFHTKTEAESYALDLAKKWIDDTKHAIPEIRLDR
jgi:hypothetical protein